MLAAAFNCPTYSDYTVTNTGDGHKLHLHRVVLDTIPYFHSLLSTQTKEVVTGNLSLPPDDFNNAARILEFLYARRVPNGGLMKAIDWMETMALAEMWQYHEFIISCMPVVVRLLVDDWSKFLLSLRGLINPKYSNIIAYFFTNQFFLDNIRRLLSQNAVCQEVWDVVSHPKYPLSEILRSGNQQALIEWLKTHSPTQSEALLLEEYNKPPNQGIPSNYVENTVTPDYDEDAYYDRYPDSP